MVSVASAEGLYTTVIENTPVAIEFSKGPFGPGEAGTAIVSVDNAVYGTYSYVAASVDNIIVYDVAGFYTFIDVGGVLNTYQDVGVTLHN